MHTAGDSRARIYPSSLALPHRDRYRAEPRTRQSDLPECGSGRLLSRSARGQGERRSSFEWNEFSRPASPRRSFVSPTSPGSPWWGPRFTFSATGESRRLLFQSNPQLSLPDLGPPGFLSNKRFEVARSVVLTLPGNRFVYDVRTGRAIGQQKQLTVSLDPYEPTILSTSGAAIPSLAISGPRHLRAGESGTFALALAGSLSGRRPCIPSGHCRPSGSIVAYYSGNLTAPKVARRQRWPLAVNDKPGNWEIRVKDLLSGQTRASTVAVSAGN